jgi:hypothetical protein
MKKIQLLFGCLGLVAVTSVSAQPVFSEDFNGTTPLSTWTLFNIDARTPAANVSFVNDAWVTREDYDTTGVGDNIAVSTSWYAPAGTADDYMVTPAITLTNNNVLFYDAKAQDPAYPDGYELRISTTVPTVAGLLANPALFTIAGENATWTRRSVSLSSYAGQTVYLGWRNNSNDQFVLCVDNVLVEKVFSNDAKVNSLSVASSQVNASTVAITGSVINTGIAPLTSVVVNWSSDGGVTVNSNTMTMNLASFTSATFSHPFTLTAANPGNFTDIDVWTSLPNAVPDSNAVNDTISTQFFVNGGTTVSRGVLLEEFTTAPCQFCPDGAVVVEQILAANPAVIGVGEHACFGTDAMTIPEASTYCAAFGSGAPTACIDRVLFAGESNVAHGRGTWAANANSRSAIGAVVDVTLTGSYNAATRATTVNIDANFVDYALPGDIRISLFVVEDSVTGVGSLYDQENAYNTQAGHPYAGAGNPIVGYVHRHVLRDVYPANDAWGVANIIPTSPAPNSNYTTSYTFNLNSAWKENDVSLVAFVNYFNSNTSERIVLNATDAKLNNLITSVDEILTDVNSLRVYPNPTADLSTIEFNLSVANYVSMKVRDIAGKEVLSNDFGRLSSGVQKITLDATILSNGVYFATIQIGDELVTRKISVNR